MATLMTHPLHGATHAYSAQEVESLQARGWSVPKEPAKKTLTVPPSKKKQKEKS